MNYSFLSTRETFELPEFNLSCGIEQSPTLSALVSSFRSYEDSELPHKEGWLKKKSPKVLKGWQSRYFVLSNKVLSYYSDENKENPLGLLNFDQISVKIIIKPKICPTNLLIMPLGSKRVFHLKSKYTAEISSWARALQVHIDDSLGKQEDLPNLSETTKFWKYNRVSQGVFLNDVSTGDILLFRSKLFASKLQRCATRSDYDHVAMILKYEDGEIGFLEATLQEGVNITLWDTYWMDNWHTLYKRIAYRNLEIERSETTLKKLENFLNGAIGKRFKISLGKLVHKYQYKEPGTEKHFFCSELIASTYKAMGLLPTHISSSSYWPGDFSAAHKLKLLKGSLGPEKVIDMSL
ncbi:unnamed protein product [Blepharisma stoltei]|uniref:PH domain-containing protein n=1 Tax=Blepharisma stoltei TaxID=1481888 RepID=A0AAU9JKB6_9CILI|nr:unnamed protein product [Blepharisma stoltei]